MGGTAVAAITRPAGAMVTRPRARIRVRSNMGAAPRVSKAQVGGPSEKWVVGAVTRTPPVEPYERKVFTRRLVVVALVKSRLVPETAVVEA